MPIKKPDKCTFDHQIPFESQKPGRFSCPTTKCVTIYNTLHTQGTGQKNVIHPIVSQFNRSKTTGTCPSHFQKRCILLCISNAHIPLDFSQNTSFSYTSTKHQLSSPLFLGSNMHRIHDETNIFRNLLCSHRMLFKFCFYC